MSAANVLQRRWCEALLARAPQGLRVMRANIASSATFLEEHPSRVLIPSHRERLVRYERLLDAHGATIAPASTKTIAPKQRQLALALESRKADRP